MIAATVADLIRHLEEYPPQTPLCEVRADSNAVIVPMDELFLRFKLRPIDECELGTTAHRFAKAEVASAMVIYPCVVRDPLAE